MFSTKAQFKNTMNSQFELAKIILRSGAGMFGVVLILAFIVIAVIGPFIAPYNPDTLNLPGRLLPPSAAHLFGTDNYGRDIYSRVLYATRVDLELAVISISISYAIGVTLGIVSGYFGKIADNIIMRVMDILFAFPSVLFAIAIAISIGAGFTTVVIAVSVIAVPSFARIARSTVLSTKEELYVMGAQSIGSSRGHIMVSHILPSAIAPTVVLYTLNLGYAILTAAALTFLGVGIPPPAAEWGGIIDEGLQFIYSGQWWITIFPGIFLTLAVMGFNMFGDALREAMDVTLRR